MTSNGKQMTAGAVTLAVVMGAVAFFTAPGQLPMYVYEGETILGHTVPAKRYVRVWPSKAPAGPEVSSPVCDAAWANTPCRVDITNDNDGSNVRLHVWRCLNWNMSDLTQRVAFDEVDCQKQRAFDVWAEAQREKTAKTP